MREQRERTVREQRESENRERTEQHRENRILRLQARGDHGESSGSWLDDDRAIPSSLKIKCSSSSTVEPGNRGRPVDIS